MDILVKEENGLIYSTVDLIAKHCEVNTKSTQELIVKNIDMFKKLSDGIKKDILSMSVSNGDLKIPELKLVMSKTGKTIDWKNTKLYQPHIEALLMLMKNTKIVTQHKFDLIRELFVLRAKTLMQEYQNRMLQKERDMLLLEKENKKLEKKVRKLELDKFIDWDEDYTTASRYVKEHPELNITASELLDLLSDKELIETKIVTRQVRVPVEGKSINGKNGTLLVKEFDIDKLFKI